MLKKEGGKTPFSVEERWVGSKGGKVNLEALIREDTSNKRGSTICLGLKGNEVVPSKY